jgi:hypothetical protein
MPKAKNSETPDLVAMGEQVANEIIGSLAHFETFECAEAVDLTPIEKAAGVDYDLDDRVNEFARTLPENLRDRFNEIAHELHGWGYAQEKAAYAVGLAVGKRLARLEGGAR